MQKEKLLELLRNYDSNHPSEKKSKQQIIDFIQENEVLFGKKNPNGHITASAWIINSNRRKALLTHHKKLNRWLQLGGHTEENESVPDAALREAKEESGLVSVEFLSPDIFDIDVHEIPAFNDEKMHYHYDIRFLFQADEKEAIKANNESKEIKWVPLERMEEYSDSLSILRMVDKTIHLKER